MFEEISAKELQQRLAAGENLHVLDVRETDEFASGHIPGALNIPTGLIPVKLDEIDKTKQWYVICLSGGRSATVAAYLAHHGWKAANVAGGMMAWTGDVE